MGREEPCVFECLARSPGGHPRRHLGGCANATSEKRCGGVEVEAEVLGGQLMWLIGVGCGVGGVVMLRCCMFVVACLPNGWKRLLSLFCCLEHVC